MVIYPIRIYSLLACPTSSSLTTTNDTIVGGNGNNLQTVVLMEMLDLKFMLIQRVKLLVQRELKVMILNY